MGEVAFGRYRLIALIGEGGMGKVYKAHDTAMGRDVAIKVLPPELATEPGYEQRFRREAYTAARLTEPHIIPIHEAGEIDGRLYLVMPIVEGIDVHTLLQRDGPMSPQRAVQVIEQLAAALNAAHAAGLVHRDIKPSNALVTGDEFVYLIDFGIAHDAAATRLTSTGMMVGTLAYMAPERFTAGTADVRADVYALACVLYECLTGVTPYPGTSMEQQIAGHLTLDPPKPSSLDPAIPAGFDEVIAAGMAKKPDQRYQSARELALAARRALTGVPTPARNPHTARSLFADPTLPAAAPEPVWQQPADLDLAAAQQRPPKTSPTTLQPWWSRQRRPGLIVAIAAIAAIAAIVAAVITVQVLQPPSPVSQTPTAQPAPPSSVVPSPTAPSTGVPGLTPFVGVWQAHTGRLVIDSTGTGHMTYQTCTACPTPTQQTLDFTLTSVSNGFASGSVTASSDSYNTGKPVTATLAAASPGQFLQMTIANLMWTPFCDNAAEAAGQCAA